MMIAAIKKLEKFSWLEVTPSLLFYLFATLFCIAKTVICGREQVASLHILDLRTAIFVSNGEKFQTVIDSSFIQLVQWLVCLGVIQIRCLSF